MVPRHTCSATLYERRSTRLQHTQHRTQTMHTMNVTAPSLTIAHMQSRGARMCMVARQGQGQGQGSPRPFPRTDHPHSPSMKRRRDSAPCSVYESTPISNKRMRSAQEYTRYDVQRPREVVAQEARRATASPALTATHVLGILTSPHAPATIPPQVRHRAVFLMREIANLRAGIQRRYGPASRRSTATVTAVAAHMIVYTEKKLREELELAQVALAHLVYVCGAIIGRQARAVTAEVKARAKAQARMRSNSNSSSHARMSPVTVDDVFKGTLPLVFATQ